MLYFEEEEIIYSNKAKIAEEIKFLTEKIVSENLKIQGLEIREELILYKGRFFILQGSEIVGKILKEFHDGYIGGHSGIDRTFNGISINFWWKGMMKDTREYVNQ